MSYIYERFEDIFRLRMGMWHHTYIITTTVTSPDLWELAESLPYASVQTMPLQGCRTLQTAAHVHVIPIYGVWALSQVVHGHMTSHSHEYHHRHFPRFVSVGWNPTWCKCANHATMLWLRLLNLSDYILCPWQTYMRCLSTCSDCGWAYGFTFTSLPLVLLTQIWESWLKSYLMQVCKPCHYTLVEAVEPRKLHPMSISYIYEVFKHLLRLWMGVWLHTHTIITTDASPDLWELAEILPYANVQTMPIHFGWGCRTFQTASHVHAIHIWSI